MHSTETSEFWPCLLEKAYAKLNGSYDALKGKTINEALADFTGGVGETYRFKEAPENLTNQSEIEKNWNMNSVEGAWVTGISAGRFINHPTFHRNPQFVLTIEKPVEDGKETCTVVVALMQKDKYRSKNKENVHIGFSIYRMEDSGLSVKPQKQAFFYKATLKYQTKKYKRVRKVTKRIELRPGRYLIVPSTLEPDRNAEFLIHASTDCRQTFEEYDNDVSVGEVSFLNFIYKYIRWVTCLTFKKIISTDRSSDFNQARQLDLHETV